MTCLRVGQCRRHLLVPCLLSVVLAACESPPPSSFVLIVVDTLRADHLGFQGYGSPTSPHLDRWAERGVIFEHAFATSPWTLPTMGSLLTGRLLSGHAAGLRIEGKEDAFASLDPSVAVLPEELQKNGFATGAIVNNPFLSDEFGVDQGFETYDDAFTTNWRHRKANEVIDLALEWIDRHAEERFFLLVHLFDPHMTYDAPPPARGRFTKTIDGDFELPVEDLPGLRGRAASISKEESSFVRAAYDEEILFVDGELDRFFQGLVRRGLWDRLVVALTSDHGEELFEHGGFEHGHSMYQELLHVPLVLWASGVKARRLSVPVSVADVGPTLARAAGIPFPQDTFGRSLWEHLTRGTEPPPRSIVAEGTLSGPERKAIVQWPYKLIVTTPGDEVQLYELDQDPGESFNRASDLETVTGLRDALSRILESTPRSLPAREAPVSPQTLERLRSLGYVR